MLSRSVFFRELKQRSVQSQKGKVSLGMGVSFETHSAETYAHCTAFQHWRSVTWGMWCEHPHPQKKTKKRKKKVRIKPALISSWDSELQCSVFLYETERPFLVLRKHLTDHGLLIVITCVCAQLVSGGIFLQESEFVAQRFAIWKENTCFDATEKPELYDGHADWERFVFLLIHQAMFFISEKESTKVAFVLAFLLSGVKLFLLEKVWTYKRKYLSQSA